MTSKPKIGELVAIAVIKRIGNQVESSITGEDHIGVANNVGGKNGLRF